MFLGVLTSSLLLGNVHARADLYNDNGDLILPDANVFKTPRSEFIFYKDINERKAVLTSNTGEHIKGGSVKMNTNDWYNETLWTGTGLSIKDFHAEKSGNIVIN